jgi:hypothetical protein
VAVRDEGIMALKDSCGAKTLPGPGSSEGDFDSLVGDLVFDFGLWKKRVGRICSRWKSEGRIVLKVSSDGL